MPSVPLNLDPVAAADERVASLEQQVQELATANAQLSQLYERRLTLESRLRHIATGMHQVLDVDAILSFGVAELVAVFGHRAVVYRLGADGAVEVVAQCFDDTVAPVRELGGISLPEQLHRQAWRLAARQMTTRIGDVAGAVRLDAATRQYLLDLGVAAMMSGVIQTDEAEVLLVVVHGLARPRTWSDDDVSLFDGIVRETATALRNAVAVERQEQALRARQQLDRDKDAFVSNVSHELRTPLTSVLGYLELLRDDHRAGLNEEQVVLLGIVERNASRLLSLIEDLLLLSRVQDEERPQVHEMVPLDDVVRAIIATVRPSARDRGLTLDTDLPVETVNVMGDEGELERALLNLVTNAIKFTPDDGRVGIEVSCCDDRVRVRVSDDGIGIPEKEQNRLFERFYRGSAAQRSAATGSGLGLAITHHIVQRHGGTIELSSSAGEGTTVVVELPR